MSRPPSARAWEPLDRTEDDAVWEQFGREFAFRPSVYPRSFPGIREPSPSATFALPTKTANHPPELRDRLMPEDRELEDLGAAALAAFRACTEPSEALYALDWQHQGYRLRPHLPFEEWIIPIVPDGDYYIFLARDFTWGIFGHPWEWTVCVFGRPLLAAFELRPPRLFREPLRRR